MKKVLLILNYKSGRQEILFRLQEVLNVFMSHNYVVNLQMIVYKDDINKFIKLYAKESQIIVCAGGDGTLNAIVNSIIKNRINTPIGYIPCGSTNDCGNSLGLPTDVVEATKRIIKGKKYAIDVIKYGNNYCVYVAAFGAFSKISYSTPQELKNMFGHTAYLINGIGELSNIQPVDLKIVIDDKKKFEGQYIMGFIANSKSIAGIIKFDNSKINMSDGKFEIFLLKTTKDIFEWSNIAKLFEIGQDNSLYTFIQAKKAKISFSGNMMWSVDGEGASFSKSQTFSILHNAIKIIK